MIFNIHAGHGASNSKSCGTIGLINESDEARKVKNEVVRLLKEQGHTVYDTTVDYPTSSQDCLNKIVTNCNKNSVDLDVSIHFNSAANDKVGNGVTTGVEVYLYNSTSKAKPYAERVCKKISALGFKNRGVKYSTKLAVLKTKNPNMLIECCFVDDRDDVKLYDYKSMAKAIVEGILNKEIKDIVDKPQVSTGFKNGDYTGKKAKVIANVLNVRYDRGTQYDVIGKLNKGDIVKLNYCLNDWISIEGYKGNKGLGYINTNYIELI